MLLDQGTEPPPMLVETFPLKEGLNLVMFWRRFLLLFSSRSPFQLPMNSVFQHNNKTTICPGVVDFVGLVSSTTAWLLDIVVRSISAVITHSLS